jgi:hypothetical protein
LRNLLSPSTFARSTAYLSSPFSYCGFMRPGKVERLARVTTAADGAREVVHHEFLKFRAAFNERYGR